MQFKKVGIIGLGLIGGSIAKRLKQMGCFIGSIQSKSADALKAKKIIDRFFPTLEALAEEVDLIVIATPLSSIVPIAREISSSHPLLVIDVGSVKEPIVKEFAKLTKGSIEFLSTHPMAGTEKKGFSHADPSLFEKARWIIVPHKKNRTDIRPWIRQLGAVPIVMDPKKHDRQTALISHLPALIAEALYNFVRMKDPKSLEIAGPGFQSMTRLAQGNPQLMEEIRSFNKKNIEAAWKNWLEFLESEVEGSED